MTMKRRDFIKAATAVGMGTLTTPLIAMSDDEEARFTDTAQKIVKGSKPTQQKEVLYRLDPKLTNDLHLAEADVYQPKPSTTEQMHKLLKQSGSRNLEVHMEAMKPLAKAVEDCINVDLDKHSIFNIFRRHKYLPETPNTHSYCCYHISDRAYAPSPQGHRIERHVEGDYVMVPIYDIYSSVDWKLCYSLDGRWDLVGKTLQLLSDSFMQKIHNDAFQVLMTAAYDRNTVAFDCRCNKGFSTRLLSLMKTMMRRDQRRLTDIYINSHNIELWFKRKFNKEEWRKALDQHGFTYENVLFHFVDFDFYNYMVNHLGYPATEIVKEGFCIGLDQTTYTNYNVETYPFWMPQPIDRSRIVLNADPSVHRGNRAGIYGLGSLGICCLDNRATLLAKC